MQNSPPRADNISRGIGLALAFIFFVLCIVGTKSAPASWNDIARVAAMESLVERGTWAIDDSAWFERTSDKVFLNGKFYSDKMPLLSWLAAGAYAVLFRFGFLLAPNCTACAYYPLTLWFVGLPAAVLIWLMVDFARAKKIAPVVALLGASALAFATMIFPYSLVFNHHVPAAVSLFAAFYLLVTRAHENIRWLFGVGLLTALAVSFDPLAGFFAVALLVMTVARFPRRAFYFFIGALPPLLVTAWLDWQIAGTIIPPYMIPNGYAYEGSAFPATIGGNGTPDDVTQYAFKMFLGAQGLFFYNPILFFALAGIGIVAWTREHALRAEAIVFGITFCVLAFYLATRTGNLGGEAYGERWFVHAIPLLMAFVFFAPPLAQNYRWLLAPLFVIALLVSVFSTYQGARNPWRYVPPPAHPTRNAETGALGWKWEIQFPWR